MGETNFNRRQCLRALRRLGFTITHARHGRHDKYYPSLEISRGLSGQQSKFIMIPRHNELRCQSEILQELRQMGGDRLVANFTQSL
ncbi:MAG: hypothetical protein V1707_00595 [bacterium]